jgi:hypothetical protein
LTGFAHFFIGRHVQDWDTTLKLLIAESADYILPVLGAGTGVVRWLNGEMPKIQNLRIDLLAELASGELLHIEIQSCNMQNMAFRMLEYGTAIYRRERRFPLQTLLYVGNESLRMKNTLRFQRLDYSFEIVDLKTVDGTALLESERFSDNLLALMMSVEDKAAAIRRIIERINRLEGGKRKDAVTRLLVTCGLRKILDVAGREVAKMPEKSIVRTLLLEDPYIIRMVDEFKTEAASAGMREGIRKGIREGRKKGIEKGIKEGRKEGQAEGRDLGKRELVRSQIRKRFGAFPDWAEERLSSSTAQQIDRLALKILDSESLEELFRSPRRHA